MMQYSKFFEILSWLTIAIKYYEHERVSPGVIHILRFFRMEKLNVKIKADLSEYLEEAQTKYAFYLLKFFEKTRTSSL